MLFLFELLRKFHKGSTSTIIPCRRSTPILVSGYFGFTDFDVNLDRQSASGLGPSTSASSSFDADAYS